MKNSNLTGVALASPLMFVLSVFLVGPIIMIVVVSFWGATEWSIYPAFLFDNYEFLLTSDVTYRVFLNTFKYALITWTFTLLIGFTVAYFLAFHIRTLTWQIALFLLCTIPFLTSNIIRMISWIPFLGRNGIANSTLISLGVIDPYQLKFAHINAARTICVQDLECISNLTHLHENSIRIWTKRKT